MSRELGIERPRITWCVRADLQMYEVHGDAAWSYRHFERLWGGLEAAGDEIAWHPHLWRWSDTHGCWYQETEDDAWMRECLRCGFEALTEARGEPPVSCRMGWEFHNNVTMQMLDELGVRIDLSAVPGRVRGPKSDRGSIRHGQLDWEGTGPVPYHPSRADYRRPPADDESALSVLEVPRAGVASPGWGLVRRSWGALRAIGRGDWRSVLRRHGDGPYVHAPCVTARPAVFRGLVHGWCSKGRPNSPFVTSFHADELIARSNDLYGLTNVRENLRQLSEFSPTLFSLPTSWRTAASLSPRQVQGAASVSRRGRWQSVLGGQ